MRWRGTIGVGLAMIVMTITGWAAKPRATKVDIEANATRTRVTVYTNEPLDMAIHAFGTKVPRLIVDVAGEWIPEAKQLHQKQVGRGPLLDKLRVGPYRRGVTRLVLYLNDDAVEWKTQQLTKPTRSVIEIRRKDNKGKERVPPAISSRETPRRPGQKVTAKTLVLPKMVTKPETERVEAPPHSQSPATSLANEIANSNAMRGLSPRLDKLSPEPEDKPGLKRRMPVKAPESEEDAVPAKNLTDGSGTLTRMLGLKLRRVIIDAGHGGHDVGSTGPTGYEEKDLVLDVALRLGALIKSRLGAEVLQTRSEDSFVGLGERTRFANDHDGDLFISVHANASRNEEATGVETYYLNFTNSADAMQVASRENATSDRSIGELNDLVKKIALKDKVTESREFASYVQNSMQAYATKVNGPMPDRGVKKALFVVLIGAKMPSILAEIGFLSNPKEEARMKKAEYRQKIAEALFQGVQKYAGTLSRVQVAKGTKQGSSDE